MVDKSKFEKTYTLKQQTPLIHFQYDEPGATLRATEVKPKLDQFIIDNVKNIENEWKLRDESNHIALDYKIKFSAVGGVQKVSLDKYVIYLGNMGKHNDSEKIKGTMADTTEMTIICHHEGLLEEINKWIEPFFLSHNFGSRQNKGFGSFVVRTGDGDVKTEPADVINALTTKYGAPYCYCIKDVENDKCFDVIKHFYGLLKSGYNPNRASVKDYNGREVIQHGDNKNCHYRKSMIVEYFSEKRIGGEKACLKKNGLAPAFSQGTTAKYDDYHFIRVLLGYPSSYTFLSDNEKKIYTNNRNGKRVIGKETVTVSNMINDDKVNDCFRFHSPIIFKVIKGENGHSNIYFTGMKLSAELLKQQFRFSNRDRKVAGKSSIDMTPPTVREDFVFDFLEFAFIKLNEKFEVPFSMKDRIGKTQIVWHDYTLEKYERRCKDEQ